MAKEAQGSEDTVKLQIPIDSTLAEQIDALAQRMGRSRSWMVGELLEIVVEQREHFADWWTWRLINAGLAKPIKKIVEMFGASKPRKSSGEIAYVQAYVEPDLVRTIAKWADKMQEPESKMAALLLACAVENNDWIIHIVTSRFVTSLAGKPYHAGKGSAVDAPDRGLSGRKA